MLLLPIGATVRCRDGAAGRLIYVVVDPDDGEVTHLIVERGLLLRRDIVVPAAWVERSSEHEIVLNASAADLNALPEYREVDYIEPDRNYRPPSGHRPEQTLIWVSPYVVIPIDEGRPWILRHVRLGVPENEVVLRRGLPVQARTGSTIGVVDHLVVDPKTQQVTHLVVRRGWLWNRQAYIVPLKHVEAVTEFGVWLDMTAEEVEQAPIYQAPASDAEIAAALQRALETDPRTRDAGLRIEVQGGVVRFIDPALKSVTKEVMEAAHAIARRLRGVIGFADEIDTLPVAKEFPPLRIGAPVHAQDGKYGKLARVVVDPHRRRVAHLIVSKGWLLTKDRVIPVERVARVEPDGMHLDAPAAELDQYPAYREEAFVEPLPGWEELAFYPVADTLIWGGPYLGVVPPIVPLAEYIVPKGVPEGEVVLRRDAALFYDSEPVGALDHVLYNPSTGEMTYLVVRTDGRRVIVPADWVERIDTDLIILNQWAPDRPGVPIYEATHTDAAIANEVNAGMQANPALSQVQAQVDSGLVHLSGNVATVAEKAEADAIARNTPGVIDVHNALDADTVLFGRVTAALAADRRLALLPIEVIADRGVVTLKGVLPSLELKQAAESIARRVPGVVAVLNELEVRTSEPKQPVLMPAAYMPLMREQ